MTNNEAKEVLENIWDFAISPDDCSGDILERAIDVAISALDVNHNHGWIPCSERLPDDELENAIKERGAHAVFPVLATVRRKKDIIVSKAFYSSYGGNHFLDLHTENLDVIAWQPLPAPYEEE